MHAVNVEDIFTRRKNQIKCIVTALLASHIRVTIKTGINKPNVSGTQNVWSYTYKDTRILLGSKIFLKKNEFKKKNTKLNFNWI